MNKLKLTKGRLREIIFEEVQRAKRLDEAWRLKAEEDEAAEEASETDAAQYMTQAEGVVDEAHEGGEGVHDIFNLPEDAPPPESSGNPKEDAIRDVVRTQSMSKVEGATLDLYSASAIVKVLDALNDANKERFLKLSVPEMAKVSLKMVTEDSALMKNIDRWSEEGKDIPPERTAAKMRDAAPEDWEAHFRDAAADDTAHIDALERDRREDEDSEEDDPYGFYSREIREQVQQSLEEILNEDPVDEGAEERVAKFNKGPSTEERREKLKKIAAANKAKKEKDKK